VLDYGAWARGLSAERLTRIFETGPFASGRTFQAAFADRFGGPPPATINETHRLVIVAFELEGSTQRIVEYLLDAFGVPVNAVFFKYFRDGDTEYLGRSWLKDPQAADEQARDREPKRTPGEWNGTDYYVLFGDDLRRSWEDARLWSYIGAGGGRRWSGPLQHLQPGARGFVHHPHDGTSESDGSWPLHCPSPIFTSPATAARSRSATSPCRTITSRMTPTIPSGASTSCPCDGSGRHQQVKDSGRRASSPGA